MRAALKGLGQSACVLLCFVMTWPNAWAAVRLAPASPLARPWASPAQYDDGAYLPRPGGLVRYRGFTIDLSQTGDPALLPSLEHQIDIVEGVGLSHSLLRRFQRLPIVVRPGLGDYGAFGGGSSIFVGGGTLAENKPIVLHEYMHFFHHTLPGGVHNREILRFFAEARAGGLYPPGSYVLSNPQEFFAVTASLYLFGSVARPPYTRDNLRVRQPEYFAYLGRLFGRRLYAQTALSIL